MPKKVIPGRVSWLSPLPKETNDAQSFAQSAHAPDQTGARPQLLYCPTDLTAPAIAMMPVFHEVSRAERPSQQGRKTHRGTRFQDPGTDKTAMDFRRLLPEIRWQSCLSPEGPVSGTAGLRPAGKLKHAPRFFMKFRGPRAHRNRQPISGKRRRKSMSVPGLRRPTLRCCGRS